MNDNNLILSIFAFAIGIALYFSLPFEPVVQFPLSIAALAAACFYRLRWNILLFLFGFFWTVFIAGTIDTELVTRNRSSYKLSGTIERIDYANTRQRIFVRENNGRLIRVSMTRDIPCRTGEDVNLRVRLWAPNTINAFSNFDYARHAFWNGLSGTASVISGSCAGVKDNALRDRIHFAANNRLVDSLVLGYKSAQPREEFERVKNLGIAHVFSISGMHLTLVGGWIYFILYFFIRLFPAWTRRYPAKYFALPITAVFLFGYLILSGGSTATIRSYAMLVFGIIAILMNRKVLTLRNALLVFAAMIFANPFWLVSVGFQLSFAAIFGLLYYFRKPRFEGKSKLFKFFAIIFMMDVVATIWTAPFVVYHFNYFPTYTLFGNVTMLPVFSFIIMPFVMVGAATSVIAGWREPLAVSDFVYSFVVRFANLVAELPYALIEVKFLTGFSLFLIFGGFALWIVGRHKSAIFITVAAVIYSAVQPVPVLRTTKDSEVVGFTQNGVTKFNVNSSTENRFIIPHGNRNRADCRRGKCVYRTENWTAVSFQRFVPLYRNMAKLCDYDFVISRFPLTLYNCPEKVLRGSVQIFEDGRVKLIAPNRKWNQ